MPITSVIDCGPVSDIFFPCQFHLMHFIYGIKQARRTCEVTDINPKWSLCKLHAIYHVLDSQTNSCLFCSTWTVPVSSLVVWVVVITHMEGNYVRCMPFHQGQPNIIPSLELIWYNQFLKSTYHPQHLFHKQASSPLAILARTPRDHDYRPHAGVSTLHDLWC